jgi:hypothetical protein
MHAPNGYLHAASVILLADTCAGYATIAHLPEGAKNFGGNGVQRPGQEERAVPLHPDDPELIRGTGEKKPTCVGRWAVSSPQKKDVVGTVAWPLTLFETFVGRVCGP